ncbi:MAG TPA: hypothetical protein C5S37_12210 [Methanophagales archaeon]|nr:hypothetical protein [Methanophagales archaeon]
MEKKKKGDKKKMEKRERKNSGQKGIKVKGVIALAFAICIVAVALVSASAVSLPFEISGYVFNADGSACNGPTISITNLNTGETFSTMTLTSSNYYRAKPAPSLDDFSAEDVLQFSVTAGTESGIIDHHISASDLNRGALQFNITFSEGGLKGESIAQEEPTLMPPLPQGPISTPIPTLEEGQIPAPTATMPPSEGEKGEGIPGFEAASAMIGLLAISYLILRRKIG